MSDEPTNGGEGGREEPQNSEGFDQLKRIQDLQVEQQEMLGEDFRRSVDRFFDELDPDHLHIFYRMMNYASQACDNNNIGIIFFWLGVTSTHLRKIHKMCIRCASKTHTDNEHGLEELTGGRDADSKR